MIRWCFKLAGAKSYDRISGFSLSGAAPIQGAVRHHCFLLSNMLKRYKSLPSNDSARLETSAWVSRGNVFGQLRDGSGFIKHTREDRESADRYDVNAALAAAIKVRGQRA